MEQHILMFNKSETAGENTFNGDAFEINNNHKYSKNEKTWF